MIYPKIPCQKPAIVAVINPANTAPNKAFHAIAVSSFCLDGAKTPNAPSEIPIEEKLEKLDKAK